METQGNADLERGLLSTSSRTSDRSKVILGYIKFAGIVVLIGWVVVVTYGSIAGIMDRARLNALCESDCHL